MSEHACNIRGQVNESHDGDDDDEPVFSASLSASRARPEVVGFPRFARRAMEERSLFSRREGERLVQLLKIAVRRSVERAIKPAKRKNERDSLGLVSLYYSEIRAFSRGDFNAREERTRRDPRGITCFHSPPPITIISFQSLFLFRRLKELEELSSRSCLY